MFKTLKEYFSLYRKSINVAFKSSKGITYFLLLILPIQYLIPALTVWTANNLINNISQKQMREVTLYLIIWGVLFVVNNIMVPLSVFLQGQLTDKLTFQLNTSLMEKSEELSTIDVFENAEYYDDLNIIQSEASWRPVNLIVFGSSVIGNIVTLVSMVILLFNFHYLIALAICFVLIPQGLIFYKIQQQAFEILVSNSPESRKLNYYSNVTLSNQTIKEVKMYDLHRFFLDKYKNTYATIIKGVQLTRFKQFKVSVLFLIITAIISVLSFYYVLIGIIQGKFEMGAILVFSSTIVYAMQSTSRIVEETSLLYDTLLYMKRYFSFIDLDTGNYHGDKTLAQIQQIDIRGLSFRYPGSEQDVLDDVSFAIRRGEKIAIVGENGSGKTTLIKLICALYKTEDHRIFINDVDINTLNLPDYRYHMSTVFQDFAKYNLTLGENVQISNLQNKDDNQMIQALYSSGFFPDKASLGLDQMLGKMFANATDLSGGEWQKVALGRAFFADKELLILDEPTAAIDAKIEHQILKNFIDLSRNKTVIFVTHRLSSVRQADKVLVLKQGKVVGYDSHDVLMKDNAYYSELYRLQSEPYQED